MTVVSRKGRQRPATGKVVVTWREVERVTLYTIIVIITTVN